MFCISWVFSTEGYNQQPKDDNSLLHHTLLLILLFRLTGPEGVEEEKELANSSADVEGVEGLFQSVQLRQSGDKLQDVVLQILQRRRF